jgi:hypothetical protein
MSSPKRRADTYAQRAIPGSATARPGFEVSGFPVSGTLRPGLAQGSLLGIWRNAGSEPVYRGQSGGRGFEPTVTLPPQWFQEHARFAVHHGSYLDVRHLGPPRCPRSSRVYPAPVASPIDHRPVPI